MFGRTLGSQGERRGQDPLQTLGANFPAGQHLFACQHSDIMFMVLMMLHFIHAGSWRSLPSFNTSVDY